MENLLPFFLILLVAVFFSHVFRRLHLPWVVALIVAGIVIGPHALNFFEPNDTLTFIGEIGLVFLMFVAGLETKLSTFKEFGARIAGLSFINGVIPFLAGISLGFLFGYGWHVSLLLGIIFVSSSIAVIIPSLEARGLIETRLGKSIVASTLIEDVASLVLLSVFFQTVNPITKLPLPLFYILLFGVLIALRWVLPKIQWFFTPHTGDEKDLFQQEFRTVFLILIGTVVSFQLLGLHPIIAGFFAGLVLSETIKTDVLKEKVFAIAYGIFIPTFFIIVGTQTNIGTLWNAAGAATLAGAIILTSMLSKFLSGWLGGKISGFTTKESLVIGAATLPQLSTTLAVAFAGATLGILDQELIAALVALSVVTTLLSPLIIAVLTRDITPLRPPFQWRRRSGSENTS